MKTLKCYDCDEQFSGQTPDELLNKLYTHYMSEHRGIITGASEDEKKAWMKQFHKDWEVAAEV